MYRVSDSKLLQPLLRSKMGALLIHWGAQGLFNMDRTDRILKLSLDVVGTGVLALLFRSFLATYLAIPLAAILAHTANFVFNAHPWVVLKHFGIGYYDHEGLTTYTTEFGKRAASCPALLGAGIWGGFARQDHANPDTPDVDVRVIRRPGLVNGVRSSWFVLVERSRANWRKFPLDMFLLDRMHSLSRLSQSEVPIILCDADGLLRQWYPSAGYLQDPASAS
jgi:hypothetical protein